MVADESKIRRELDKLSDDVRERLTKLTAFLDGVNRIADQLAYAVTGTFDFSIHVDTDDPTVQKLSIMMNFFLETIRRTLAQIEETNRKLLETERLKREFMANVSHELRTPLTLTLAPLESLLAGEYGQLAITQEAVCRTMHNNVVRLLQLINGLLDFSRLEVGKVDVNREPTEVMGLSRTILADFQPLFQHRGLTTDLAVHPDQAWVAMDRYLYERIVFNLLSNAAKFTPEGGRVRVDVNWKDGRVILSVSDTGIGIAPDQLQTIFEKFRQVEGSASRRFEGSGLGLALVREFAALLDGSVAVESKLGEGTTFTVEMVAPAVAATAALSEAVLHPARQPLRRYGDLPVAATGKPRRGAPLAKVLIAEDNLELATYVSALLHGLCQPRLAHDGDEALAVASQWLPDVVIADVMMPKRDGLSLCREIKANPELADTAVILLTALTHREALLKGWEAGADDYLFKPFHPKELVTRIKNVLSAVTMRKELTRELKAARDEAVVASRSKSEFLANISHEIRTPLNSVIGMTDLLLRTPLSAEQYECAITAFNSAEMLLNLINDILDFSKIEAGKLNLEVADFELLAVVESAAEIVAQRAWKKKLSLITSVAPDLPRIVKGDAARLTQVLLNLLDNAIKFTEKGEVVLKVTGSGAGKSVRFAVTDTGLGLTQAAIQQLFQPFTQIDGSITRRYGGTGLGLSISKHLVGLMGGEIGVESAEGRGSAFWFTVPLKRSRAKVKPPAPKIDLKSARLLVVDGTPSSAEMIQAYAGAWGMRCELAGSGEEALDMISRANAANDPFDVAVVELFMADMDGFTLAEALKQRPHLARTKLMLLASFDDREQGQRALMSGFSAYLVRPVKQSKLLDAICSVLAGDTILTPLVVPEPAQADSLQLEYGPGPCPLVLVAEDNPANQKLAVMQLKRLGLVAHIASSGSEAVMAAGRRCYAVILMDCQMPGMDGLEATRRIRKAEALTGARVPIIAMTAHAMVGDREKCIAAGMDDYISKPLTLESLKSVLGRWITDRPQVLLAAGATVLPSLLSPSELAAVDLAELEKVCRPEELSELIRLFLSSSPLLLKKVEETLAAHDQIGLARAGHELKGCSASYGATGMAKLSAQLETAAAAGDWQRAELLAAALRLSFEHVQGALSSRLAARC